MVKRELEISNDRCCEGYTLYSTVGSDQHAILIDMNGEAVHEWSINGAPVKMLPGGSLLGSKRSRMGKDPLLEDPSLPEEPTSSGGPQHYGPWHDAIEFIQEDWDGQEEWSFRLH